MVTYEEQILSRELPESIIIAGAGAIGMEFGYVLKNYGVDVTIVEFLPRALPNEDAEVSKEIEKQFKKLGVKILTGTKVESIADDGSVVTVTVSKDGKSEELKAEKVLQAIGFAPNVEGYGLDKAGVALTDRKAIGITDYMRTNVDHIYAIGDVTGLLQLAHVAEAQGVVAAETIAGAETLALGDYRMLPRATFCQPKWPASGSPSSRPATKATTSWWPSSRSPPTPKRTAWATPAVSSSWSPTPSTWSCWAGT